MKKSPATKTSLIPVTKAVHFHIVSLFPESFTSYISESIIARAQNEKRISINFYNPRDFVKAGKSQKGKEKPYLRIDDKPYGGGPGMVMEALPIVNAIEYAQKQIDKRIQKENKKKGGESIKNTLKQIKVLFMSPGGVQFTNELATEWVGGKLEAQAQTTENAKASKNSKSAKDTRKGYTDFIIICGRYEGVDERVNTIFKSLPVTVGPFVLTGGELPAMIIMDAMARQIPGVLGNFDSREESRTASHAVYTRPEVFEYNGKKYKVPEVLLSGDHKKIEEWREGQNGEIK